MRCVLLSTCAAVSLAWAGLVTPALAQNNIGEVALAQRDVTGAYGGRSVVLKNSDAVLQNQVVSTGADAFARLAFHDRTSVAIGPQASIKLDRFVYNPDATGRAMTLNMARGAFRFVTGNTKSKDVRITTPIATIGVRGTTVDVLVTSSRVIVVLREGAAFGCRGSTCRDVTVPGTGLIITRSGITGPTAEAAALFDFDDLTRNRFALHRHPNAGNPGGVSPGAGTVLSASPAQSSPYP